MSSILEVVSDLGTPLVAIAIAALASLLTNLFVDETSKKREKAKDKLLKLLEGNLNKGRILDLELLGHIKQSVEREFSVEIPIAHLIQDILLRLNDVQKNGENSDVDDLSCKLQELITQENKKAPFENLPEEERRLLRGLDDAIRHNDEASIKFNFDELNSVLSVRHVEHARAIKLNKWSVPLAVIGLALTIIFGIVGMQGGLKGEDIESAVKEAIHLELEKTANKSIQPTAKAAAD